MTAFAAGTLLDLLIGDPYELPHPIRWIGSLIVWLDHKLMDVPYAMEQRIPKKERLRGLVLVLCVISATALLTLLCLLLAYRMNIFFGVAVEAILTCYVLAARNLCDESMKVYTALRTGSLEASRKAVSMIVGRDTNVLDEAGVIKAAVETVAENTSDGVIAPLLYTCLGGPLLGMVYKAINTMDSMVGYHNDRYEYFGTCAAKLDDIVNYIPARISALLMTSGAALAGKSYSAKGAWQIFIRDRYKHKSPNSAQTESVCAGALGIRLAGDAQYFGTVLKKPYIGDDLRPVECDDIKRANVLMYLTTLLAWLLCMGLMLAAVIIRSKHA